MNPKRIFTRKQKQLALYLASVGMTHDQIARALGVSTPVLHREVPKDKMEAIALLRNAKIAGKVYEQAAGGDRASQFFLLKTQLRWRETMDVHMSGEISAVLPSVDEARARLERANRSLQHALLNGPPIQEPSENEP